MLSLSQYCVFAGIVAVGLALICYALAFAAERTARARMALATQGPSGEVATVVSTGAGSGVAAAVSPGEGSGVAAFGTLTALLALGFLSLALALRWLATGHGPFANMYEFSVAFAWGALLANAYFVRRYRQWSVGVIVLPVALGMLLYATTIPSTAEPLVPALQNNLLLTVHVATAVIAYGAFAVGFAAALLYVAQSRAPLAQGRERHAQGRERVVQGRERHAFLPRRELLDDLSYRATLVGFPFLTLTIVLGAVWADVAWGRYWSWDPKESASLVTWIVCLAYLHARSARGWRGQRAALLLMLVFAASMFTYFGNLFFGGLHSYG